MELAVFILVAACQFLSVRSQATVDVNPHENIPGIGSLLGGDDEKPVLDRWQFWLGIGLAAAFSIVIAYFVYRGFRNYKKLKEEQQQQEEHTEEEHEEEAAPEKTTDIENPLFSPPSPSNNTRKYSQKKIDIDELARRTGRRKKDLLASQASHQHRRSTSVTPSLASTTTTATVESTAVAMNKGANTGLL